MTVHIEGKDLRDVQQKVWAGQKADGWIIINPVTGGDYGRDPTLGFFIRWNGWDENFTRKVSSVAELFEALRPIVLAQEGRIKADIHKAERQRAKDRALALKTAKAAVKKLENS